MGTVGRRGKSSERRERTVSAGKGEGDNRGWYCRRCDLKRLLIKAIERVPTNKSERENKGEKKKCERKLEEERKMGRKL